VLKATDEDLLADTGVDAMVLLKTTRLGAYIVALTCVYDLALVLWANIHGRMPLGAFASDMDKLTIGHVPAGSQLLWVHCFSVAFKTAVVLYLMYKKSAWFADAQRDACQKRVSRAEGRTILVRHPFDGVAGARAAFASLYGESFVAALPVVDPKQITALASERDSLLVRMEDAQMRLALSKTPGERPMHRTHVLCGPRVDSIDAWTERLLEINAHLCDARSSMFSGTGTAYAPVRDAALVVFDTPRAAAIAAQVAVERQWHVWHLSVAPPPADCVWTNLGRHVPLVVQIALKVTFAALLLFYIVPITAISALSTLSNLQKLLPFIAPILKMPVVVSVLEGVLPGLALIVFMAVLPAIVRSLASASGVQTYSALDVAELNGMYWFAVLNVFLANVLAGSLFSALQHIIDKPLSIFTTLGQTVPGTSRFFIAYILLRAIGDSAGAISGIVTSLIYLAKTRMLNGKRTARREAACWGPSALSLGSQLSDTLLVLLLTIVFSTVAPLVHLAGGLYFILRVVAVKTQLIYTHEPSYEGDGILWPSVRGRVCVTLLLYQATTAGVLGLKGSAAPACIILAVIMPLTAAAQHFLGRRFDTLLPGKHAAPLMWFDTAATYHDAVADIVPADVDGSAAHPDIVQEYLPPALKVPPHASATEMKDKSSLESNSIA